MENKSFTELIPMLFESAGSPKVLACGLLIVNGIPDQAPHGLTSLRKYCVKSLLKLKTSDANVVLEDIIKVITHPDISVSDIKFIFDNMSDIKIYIEKYSPGKEYCRFWVLPDDWENNFLLVAKPEQNSELLQYMGGKFEVVRNGTWSSNSEKAVTSQYAVSSNTDTSRQSNSSYDTILAEVEALRDSLSKLCPAAIKQELGESKWAQALFVARQLWRTNSWPEDL